MSYAVIQTLLWTAEELSLVEEKSTAINKFKNRFGIKRNYYHCYTFGRVATQDEDVPPNG